MCPRCGFDVRYSLVSLPRLVAGAYFVRFESVCRIRAGIRRAGMFVLSFGMCVVILV